MADTEIQSNDQPCPSLVSGDRIAGCRILEMIGQGGRSQVYLARNEATEELVALKVLNAAQDKPAVKRFQREAQICARLSHKNIAKVKTFGIHDGNIHYLVMEYAQGIPLDQFLKKHRSIKPNEFLVIFRRVSEALSYAHTEGILHRDIKPSNIIVVNDDNELSPKVVDFGLASILNDEAANNQRLTETGLVHGTPSYMSPEQCRGERLDVRSDIYSLGCTMFHALTGTPPFTADTVYELLNKHITQEPRFPANCQSNPMLMKAILRCLQKKPEDRFQTADELLSCLNGMDSTVLTAEVPSSSSWMSIKTLVPLVLCLCCICALLNIAGSTLFQHSSRQELYIPATAKVDKTKSLGFNRNDAEALMNMSRTGTNKSKDNELYRERACQVVDAKPESLQRRIDYHAQLLNLYIDRCKLKKGLAEIETLRRLLGTPGNVPETTRFKGIQMICIFLHCQHQHKACLQACDEALKVLSTFKDPTLQKTLAGDIKEIMAYQQGVLQNYQTALRHIKDAYKLTVDDSEPRERRKIMLAKYALLANDPKTFAQTIKQIGSTEQYSEGIAVQLGELGTAYKLHGDTANARKYMKEACDIFQRNGSGMRLDHVTALINLATLEREQRHFTESRAYAEQAQKMLVAENRERQALEIQPETILFERCTKLTQELDQLDPPKQ